MYWEHSRIWYMAPDCIFHLVLKVAGCGSRPMLEKPHARDSKEFLGSSKVRLPGVGVLVFVRDPVGSTDHPGAISGSFENEPPMPSKDVTDHSLALPRIC